MPSINNMSWLRHFAEGYATFVFAQRARRALNSLLPRGFYTNQRPQAVFHSAAVHASQLFLTPKHCFWAPESGETDEWMNEGRKEGRKECMHAWMNEWMNESINQPTNQPSNQSIHPSIHPSIHQSINQSIVEQIYTQRKESIQKNTGE